MGFEPTGSSNAGANNPWPSPRNTDTLSVCGSVTAMSALPSALKSAIVTAVGDCPVPSGEFVAAVNVPSPFPRSTLTVLSVWFTTARSGWESPFTSADAMATGEFTHGKRRASRLRKRAVTVAEKNGNVTGRVIHDRQVQVSIGIEVGRRHRNWAGHRVRQDKGRTGRLLESSITVAEKQGKSVIREIRHDKVLIAIGIKIAGDDGAGLLAYGDRRSRGRR